MYKACLIGHQACLIGQKACLIEFNACLIGYTGYYVACKACNRSGFEAYAILGVRHASLGIRHAFSGGCSFREAGPSVKIVSAKRWHSSGAVPILTHLGLQS